MGRRLEELSLFLLPRATSEEDNEEDVEEAGTDRIYHVGDGGKSLFRTTTTKSDSHEDIGNFIPNFHEQPCPESPNNRTDGDNPQVP